MKPMRCARRGARMLARVSTGILATVALAALALLPAASATVPLPAPPDALPLLARFNAWCGAAARSASDAQGGSTSHDTLACFLHCLRSTPAEPRPLLAPPGLDALLPPVVTVLLRPAPLRAPPESHRVARVHGPRGPPRAA